MSMAAKRFGVWKPWVVKNACLFKRDSGTHQMKRTLKICLSVHGWLVPNMWFNSPANPQMQSAQHFKQYLKECQKAPKLLKYGTVITQSRDDYVLLGFIISLCGWLYGIFMACVQNKTYAVLVVSRVLKRLDTGSPSRLREFPRTSLVSQYRFNNRAHMYHHFLKFYPLQLLTLEGSTCPNVHLKHCLLY